MLLVLDSLVDSESRGDPRSPPRRTVKSTRQVVGELTGLGHTARSSLLGRMLHYLGYSLEANAKVTEGCQGSSNSLLEGCAVQGFRRIGLNSHVRRNMAARIKPTANLADKSWLFRRSSRACSFPAVNASLSSDSSAVSVP